MAGKSGSLSSCPGRGAARSGAPQTRDRDGHQPQRASGTLVRKVTPFRIELLDERNLPRPAPTLQRALSSPGLENGAILFHVDQLVDAVTFSEARDETTFVLGHAPGEVVGHADVERAVAPVGKNVDEI